MICSDEKSGDSDKEHTDSMDSSGENVECVHNEDGFLEEELLPQQTSSPSGETSTLGSIFLIVNAALGAGLLNFPQAFDLAGGVLTAVIVQALLLVFIMSALIILAQTSNIKRSVTLQEVMDTATGPWGRKATAAIVTIYCFGEFSNTKIVNS